MAIRHYLTFADFTLDQYSYLFERTKLIKRKFKNYETYHPLADQIGVEDLGEYMETLELLYRREAQAMPSHADLIARHCAART